ncbi:MAG TPA: helix-turn-helix transcriptional regulator [Bacteroidales bacterium]|nr:helix-turn-helix transcriptional regulator [Bacteroidales bacterium]HSA43564.1 helix-turn-helix transcriptional regulator [Bacteroidales bacterium]
MKKNSEISERIKQLIESLGINANLFAKKLGYTRSQAIYDILNGKAAPSNDFYTKLLNSEYSESVDLSWLISGKKSVLKYHVPHSLVNSEEVSSFGKGIPYYETLPASAGDLPVFLQNAKPTSYFHIPNLVDCDAILPVIGFSMRGVVEPGDMIAVKEIKTRSEFDSEKLHLIVTDEYRMIKYLHPDKENQELIWAVSTNMASIKLSADSILKIYAIQCIVRFC